MDYNNRMDQVIFTIFEHPVDGAEFNGWVMIILLVLMIYKVWKGDSWID